MFEFLHMAGNYDSRKVARYEDGEKNIIISTAFVNDSSFPYETAIKHPEYNEGYFIIVENYNDEISAKEGHKKWEQLYLEDNLPDPLIDIGESGCSKILDIVSEDESHRKFYRKSNPTPGEEEERYG